MAKQEKTLASQVQKIVIQQGLKYLPKAMDTLGELSEKAESAAVRVQASRAIISSMSNASGELTENEAGAELLQTVRDAAHAASIETEVPEGIKESFDA